MAGSAGPVLGLADLLGGGQVRVVAAHDRLDHRFGGGLRIRRMPGWRGVSGDDVGDVRLPAPGQPDVQGPSGQGAGDEEVGGVHGAALSHVGVARVVQLGAVRQIGPRDFAGKLNETRQFLTETPCLLVEANVAFYAGN